ncbi:MAG: tRNA (adenosine(37)-N6)-threonylcarbamoyltransferase complex dimerization subunit type 1 TsaB, partial [Chitinophagaceae bacterium]
MSLILNIDCAAENSLVQLVDDSTVLGLETNMGRSDNAAFLHPAIERLFKNHGKQIGDLSAVAVTEGPGSYTGIRIGMATAKGLCLATGKPIILLNRLWLMAAAVKKKMPFNEGFYCPMMDAR